MIIPSMVTTQDEKVKEDAPDRWGFWSGRAASTRRRRRIWKKKRFIDTIIYYYYYEEEEDN